MNMDIGLLEDAYIPNTIPLYTKSVGIPRYNTYTQDPQIYYSNTNSLDEFYDHPVKSISTPYTPIPYAPPMKGTTVRDYAYGGYDYGQKVTTYQEPYLEDYGLPLKGGHTMYQGYPSAMMNSAMGGYALEKKMVQKDPNVGYFGARSSEFDSKFVPRNSVVIDSLDVSTNAGFFVPQRPTRNNGRILPDIIEERALSRPNVAHEKLMIDVDKTLVVEPPKKVTYEMPKRTESVLPKKSHVATKNDEVEEKKSKKRKRENEPSDPKFVQNIEDAQDHLVMLSCREFDEYVSQVSKARTLSTDESSLVKDIRRRIKNRESARKCRKNRRDKLESLEEKIKRLVEENHSVLENIASLKSQNQCMKEEVTFMKNIIDSNPVFNLLFEEYSKCPVEKRDEQIKQSLNNQSSLLLSVLFSFGTISGVLKDTQFLNKDYLSKMLVVPLKEDKQPEATEDPIDEDSNV